MLTLQTCEPCAHASNVHGALRNAAAERERLELARPRRGYAPRTHAKQPNNAQDDPT